MTETPAGAFPQRQVWMPVKIDGVGGPASFQRKLQYQLEKRGITLQFGMDGLRTNRPVAFVINGTRYFVPLLRAKQHGIRIVQRLGSPFPSDLYGHLTIRQRIRSWVGDLTMVLIRKYLANRVVYQSRFVKGCWESEHGPVNKPEMVVYNGVDLSVFSPGGPRYTPSGRICLLSVEGTQMQPEHNAAFRVAQELVRKGIDVELLVFGTYLADAASKYAEHPFVRFKGVVENEELPYYYRGAHVYVLNDIVNAGCPNTVVEALACGCPVIGYSPGVLPEMLTMEAGRCVPAAGDPWKGEAPGNLEILMEAVLDLCENNQAFREGARRLAVERYDLGHMADRYVEAFFG